MNQDDIWPFGRKPVSGPPATMGRAVTEDQEHWARGTVRLLAHDLSDKAFRRGNAGLALTTLEQLGAVDIPGGKISQRAGSRIFVLDTQRTPCRKRPVSYVCRFDAMPVYDAARRRTKASISP